MAKITETLIHYSDKPLGEIRSVEVQSQTFRFKPEGLWVSVEGEDDWKSWCTSAGFNMNRFSCEHEITLAPDANIIRIASACEIDAFTSEFAVPGSRLGYDINWNDVARRWQGIIIAPYIWSRRLNGGAEWYYSWDCASGCIWNASAIQAVTLREPHARHAR